MNVFRRDASIGLPFLSPSDLREFAIETSRLLRDAGFADAAEHLYDAATFPASTGSEWLGELYLATKDITRRCRLPKQAASRIKRIRHAAKSRKPYG
jgi:hypothetical protein